LLARSALASGDDKAKGEFGNAEAGAVSNGEANAEANANNDKAQPGGGGKRPVPPKKLMRVIGQAIRDWRMIEDGDRLVVGLSGGKDSLTLLFALLDLQRRAPVKFTVSAATVDPMTPSFDPRPLIEYLAALGVTYHYLENPIVDRAAAGQLQGDSLCAFCSRMKRGLLYACCREFGYNKLVLGQHLDDLAESFIMSALHNGQARTMKANYRIEAGDVSVVRPLIYAREHQTKEFATRAMLPIINENCPACFEEPKERHRVKKMLAREESLAPEIYPNLKSALLPLMGEGVYPYMDLVRLQVHANGDEERVRRGGRTGGNVASQRKSKPRAGPEGGARGNGQAQRPASAVPAVASAAANDPAGEEEKRGCGAAESAGLPKGAPSEALGSAAFKWGGACLSVLPSGWLEEELERRRRGVSGEKGCVTPEAHGDEGSFRFSMPGSSGPGSSTCVQLCNTGKCEMFD